MCIFRRDLTRAVKLLEMVKRREKMKKDDLQLSIDIYDKRFQSKDFTGQLLAEYTAATTKTRYIFFTKITYPKCTENSHFLDLHSRPSIQINFIIIRLVIWHRTQINGIPHRRHRTIQAFISITICRASEILMA